MATADAQTLHFSHSHQDEHPSSQPNSPHAHYSAQSFSTMHRSLSSNALSSYDQSQPITFMYPHAQAVPITQATVLRSSSTGSDAPPRESPRPVPALSVPPYTTANMLSLPANGLAPATSASVLSMLSAQQQHHQLLSHIAALSAPSPSGQAPPSLYIPQHPHVIHAYYPGQEPHSPNYSFSDPEREEMDDEVFRPSTMNGSDIKTDLPLDPSQRRSLINQEQQKILLANEKEDAHWSKQEQRFKKMVERLNTGAKTCEELHNFLLRSTKVMAAFSQAMLEQGSFGSRETGSLRQACIAQDVFGHSIYEHFGEMKERVFAESIKQANMLAQTMKKRVYTMQEMGVKHAKSIKIHRDKVAEAWAAYEKAFSERQKAELSNKPVRNDPFLACRVYDRELADLRSSEKEYAKEMSKLFLELRIDDGRRIDAIKTIMLDYLLAQKALLEHTVKFTESVIASVKGVDREADVNEFITHADLLMNVSRDASGSASMTPHTHTIFELPPPNRDPNTMSRLYGQEVEKEGMLCRQGKVFKSNWKDILVAISTSGFLHYFDDPKGSVPDLTICLSSCTVHVAPTVHSCAFEVHEPNRSFFNFSGAPTVYAFKAETEEQMEQWVAAIKKYTERTFTGSDLTSPAAAAATTSVGAEPSHVSTNPAISSRVSGPPSSAGSTGTAASHMAPSSSPNSSPSHSPTPVAGGDSPTHLPMPDSAVAGPPPAQLE